MAPLPWLPKSLADQTESWGWTNTVSSALGSLKEQGEQIMQPIGQQIASAMPQPAPFQMPEDVGAADSRAPQVKLPEIRPFELPSMESWGFGQPAPAQPQAPQGFQVGPEAQTSASVTRKAPGASTGGFSLPGPEAWGMGPVKQAAEAVVGAVTGGTSPSSRATSAVKGELDNSSRQAFIRSAYPYALEAADGDPVLANQLVATAISENGKVGTGRSLGEMGFNVGGIQGVKGPAGSFMASDAGNMREFAAYNNLSEGFRAVRDLVSAGARYQPAAAAYRQSGDVDRYWQQVNQAGYAEDPDWHAKVGSIRRNQVEPLTKGLQAAPAAAQGPPTAGEPGGPPLAPGPVLGGPSPAAMAPDGVPTAVAEGAGWRDTWGKNLTPHQINETLGLGLSWDAALATCGIAASIAFARANGRNPTFKEALDLAQKTGEWNPSVGMTHGTAGQIALLKGLGVDAETRPLDEQEIAKTVTAGQPVQINAHGNGGHFYVAQGYDPQTGKFDFGNSAAILKRAGGKTWFRLNELAGLGVGSPSEAIYLRGR